MWQTRKELASPVGSAHRLYPLPTSSPQASGSSAQPKGMRDLEGNILLVCNKGYIWLIWLLFRVSTHQPPFETRLWAELDSGSWWCPPCNLVGTELAESADLSTTLLSPVCSGWALGPVISQVTLGQSKHRVVLCNAWCRARHRTQFNCSGLS